MDWGGGNTIAGRMLEIIAGRGVLKGYNGEEWLQLDQEGMPVCPLYELSLEGVGCREGYIPSLPFRFIILEIAGITAIQ